MWPVAQCEEHLPLHGLLLTSSGPAGGGHCLLSLLFLFQSRFPMAVDSFTVMCLQSVHIYLMKKPVLLKAGTVTWRCSQKSC